MRQGTTKPYTSEGEGGEERLSWLLYEKCMKAGILEGGGRNLVILHLCNIKSLHFNRLGKNYSLI